MSANARFRYTMVAGATAVVIGTGFTVIGLNSHPAPADAAPVAGAVAAAPATSPGTGAPATPPAATSTTSPPSRPSATPGKPAATRPPRTAAPRPKPSPTRTVAGTPQATTGTGGSAGLVGQVLAHINAARTAAGLAPLKLDADLSKASALHNQLMINGCGLAHECRGEQGLGDRFSAQGVTWSSAGENIGYASSKSDVAAMVKAADGLTDSMLAETPPNDGHRKNLLNKNFKRIGLAVTRDGKGVTWMTQDFVN